MRPARTLEASNGHSPVGAATTSSIRPPVSSWYAVETSGFRGSEMRPDRNDPIDQDNEESTRIASIPNTSPIRRDRRDHQHAKADEPDHHADEGAARDALDR